MGSIKEASIALKAIPLLTQPEIELVNKRAMQGVQACCIVDEISAERAQAARVDELIGKLGARNLLGFLTAEDYVAAIHNVRAGIPVQEVVDRINAKVEAFKATLATEGGVLSKGPD
ncbi:hypothetical protein [Massilia violaceinigra]|nr:hypothetical protein [Massilia violaceinigra]